MEYISNINKENSAIIFTTKRVFKDTVKDSVFNKFEEINLPNQTLTVDISFFKKYFTNEILEKEFKIAAERLNFIEQKSAEMNKFLKDDYKIRKHKENEIYTFHCFDKDIQLDDKLIIQLFEFLYNASKLNQNENISNLIFIMHGFDIKRNDPEKMLSEDDKIGDNLKISSLEKQLKKNIIILVYSHELDISRNIYRDIIKQHGNLDDLFNKIISKVKLLSKPWDEILMIRNSLLIKLATNNNKILKSELEKEIDNLRSIFEHDQDHDEDVSVLISKLETITSEKSYKLDLLCSSIESTFNVLFKNKGICLE